MGGVGGARSGGVEKTNVSVNQRPYLLNIKKDFPGISEDNSKFKKMGGGGV